MGAGAIPEQSQFCRPKGREDNALRRHYEQGLISLAKGAIHW